MAETSRNALTKAEGTHTLPEFLLAYLNANLETIDAAIAKANWAATVPPEATDDDTGGYATGSLWLDTVTQTLYLCTDPTEDSAVWEDIWPVDASGLGSMLTEAGDIPYWTGSAVAPIHHSTRGYALLSGGHGLAPYFDGHPVTGWVEVDDGWVYSWADAPMYGIYMSGNLTNIYVPGLKLRATQAATDRYFEVVSSEYSAPYTNVTLRGIGDSVLANAVISSSHISFGVAPNGWPESVSSGDWVGFSTEPVYVSWDADIKQGVMKVEGVDLTDTIYQRDRIYLQQSSSDKWFIVAWVELSGSDSLITVYGGNTFTLANAEIVGACYSKVLAPIGFPSSGEYWDIEVTDTTLRSIDGLDGIAYTDLGSKNIILGIGLWELSLHADMEMALAEAGVLWGQLALSASSSEYTDSDMIHTFGGGPLTWIQQMIHFSKVLDIDTKTTYYLLMGGDSTDIDFALNNDATRLRILARFLLV